jgi:hypothetical protein
MAIFNTVYGGERKWKPWANTVAYYPLTSTTTVNDMSGNNRNLTNNWATFWTYQWISCVYWTARRQRINTPSLNWVKTISLWTNWSGNYANSNSNFSVIYADEQATALAYRKYNDYKFQFYDGVENLINSYITNQRYNLVVTFDGTAKIYINWQLLWQGTNAVQNTGWIFYFMRWVWTGDTADGYLWWISNIVLENKVRTDQEISDYYNQTKWNYWL